MTRRPPTPRRRAKTAASARRARARRTESARTARAAATAVDPIARFRRWYARAEASGAPLPDAMALATADARGRPTVRFVLLKGVGDDGFVFFTDSRSRKGRDLDANPRAAAVFYWHRTGRQVRIEGDVRGVSDAEADAYWASRPRESRLAAASSTQSAPIAARSELMRRWRALARSLPDGVPRPAAWRGFRIVPDAIEFWTRGEHRLHDRERFERVRGGWRRTRLQP
jgi:pyridoxamine 5'-phosphate oxidase